MWGPPGTGKSTLVERIARSFFFGGGGGGGDISVVFLLYLTRFVDLDIVLACNFLTPGDFNKNLVGDKEEMLRQLGDRAREVDVVLDFSCFILAVFTHCSFRGILW